MDQDPRTARLLLPGGGSFALDPETPTTAGRDPACALRIDGPLASREHFRIAWSGEAWQIEDLGSRNGTIVDGAIIHAPTELRDGALILAAGREFRFAFGIGSGGRVVLDDPVQATIEIDLAARGTASASAVQRRMLGSLPEVEGWALDAAYRGVDGISGDFYDAALLPDGRLLLVLGDVSGHGVGAALVMSAALNCIRGLRASCRDAADLLVRLNAEATGFLPPGHFLTVSAVELDPGSGRGRVVCAGHHGVVIAGPRRATAVVGTPGPAIGVVPGEAFARALTPVECRLAPEEVLVQCSDGVIEAGDLAPSDGLERLGADLAALGGHGWDGAAAALAEQAAGRSARRRDDITVLLVRRLAAAATALRLPDEQRGPLLALVASVPTRVADPARADADYRLGPVIGAGGGGVVHEAVQAVLGRTVAIKRAAREDAAPVIVRETVVAAALDHPHVLPVHEVGRDAALGVFFAMRRPTGGTWRGQLAALGLERNLDVLQAVADAAACAHAHGIIHRDIKPENVLVGDDGAVYLFDWGMAAATAEAPPAIARVLARPRPGIAVGTPAYMAPEAAIGDAARIGPATDVWALGAVLAEVLSGAPPRQGDSSEQLAAAARGETPALDPEEPLASVAAAACQRDPAQRPRDARGFRAALVECRRTRQSTLLRRRADALVAGAGPGSAGIDALTRARVIYEQALLLWPENAAARTGSVHARLRHARIAMAAGDLGQAALLLDPSEPEHAEGLLDLGRAQRDTERERADLARVQERTRRSWTTLMDAARIDGSHGLVALGGTVIDQSAEGVRLWAPHWVHAALPVEVALDLDLEVTLRGSGSGLYGVAFACPIGAPSRPDIGDAYRFDLADRIRLSRGGEVIATADHAPPPARGWVTLQVIREGAEIIALVDGRRVIEAVDRSPLSAGRRGWIILYCEDMVLEVASVRVRAHTKPELEDLLGAAERFLLRGRHDIALALAEDVLADEVPAARRERGEAIAARAHADLALIEHHRQAATQIAERWPGARLIAREGGLHLHLAPGTCADLAPVAGLPLDVLVADRNRIADLRPLTGMPLRRLLMSDNPVADLAPIAGLPLERLVAVSTQVADIAPVCQPRLRQLSIDNTAVRDLAPLRGTGLVYLGVSGCDLPDIGPLASLPLGELWMGRCRIGDLGPLAATPLVRLGLTDASVADISALRGLALRALFLDGTRVADLRPLTGMPLRLLNIARTPVTDLAPLAGMPLETLTIVGCGIDSVAPLAGCPLTGLIYGPREPRDLHLLPPGCTLTRRR